MFKSLDMDYILDIGLILTRNPCGLWGKNIGFKSFDSPAWIIISNELKF
jgi:hypothetical protein